ncbi:MAG: Gfo/Idh/MocA family oxidoreductase [Lachnospiraceae bacterium]|nr:Gfo/Idh/MocA family oxidoreductase [Lachnospiraceae bacterium]
MYKIGCIGHAGRHGEFFSRLFNREQMFDGYRFSYVFGEDEELSDEEKNQRFYHVDAYCPTVDELIEKSDAVMILTIPGESHLPYALKVIKARKPVFVDKPFATTYEDAKAITEAARAYDVPLFGGSTLRHLKKLDEIRQLMKEETFPFVSISYRADPESPLGLYHYYASHIAEICISLCGAGYQNIAVSRNGKNICTVVTYPHCSAVLMTTLDTELVNIHLTGKKSYSFDLNQDECYIDGATKFIQMIQTGRPPVPYEEYCQSVRLIQDITCKMNALMYWPPGIRANYAE